MTEDRRHHWERHSWRQHGIALIMLGVLVLAGCGSSEGTATSDVGSGSAADTSAGAAERTVVTADAGSATTTTAPAGALTTEPGLTSTDPTSTDPTSTDPTSTDPTSRPTIDASTRLAPARDDQGFAFTFDRSAVTPLLVSGRGEPIELGADDELINVIALTSGGYAFQTSDDRTIWIWNGADPAPLLTVAENERLVLEGAGLDETGEAIVLYQRWFYGEPETTRADLISHRLSDGTTTEIAPTGGWESGASFASLSSIGVDNGDTAVASWGAEGFTWFEVMDVRTGDIVFDSQEVDGDCFDGDERCPWFDVAVPFAGNVIGLGPVWNDDDGWIDAFGLWEYDTATGETQLMQSWPWENGTWYAEDMFLDGSVLVVSLQDEPFQGAPLPPLFFDLVSGESWTLPEAVFVRPAYLS